MPDNRQPVLLALVDELLAEQGRLQTPVARFSVAPGVEPVYRDLIPLSKPGPGEQYAFEVDLDSCSGCKACVVACHALNGLEETESWRDVGFMHGGSRAAPFQQTITTACHHCADPACLNGCPVLAYEKDPATGIVRHLDDQCIGCQYCVLKCPYDVPKYSERLGIVRKCDMCHDRLAEGEAPACVQACPTHAITIVKVSVHVDRTPRVDTSAFLAIAPDPAYTQPTTRYLSARAQPKNLIAADAAALRPQPPHWPLVAMLTLLPMAVGCYTVAAIGVLGPSVVRPLIGTGWLSGALGLGASVLHLGQPLRAWRIFLGWRRSWLSREALVFGPWFAVATAALAMPRLATAVSFIGLTGLGCSVMIYVDTRREFWRLSNTAPRFFGGAAVLALAAAFALAPSVGGAFALFFATLFKLAIEARAFRPLDHHDPDEPSPGVACKTALLLDGPLRPVFGIRVVLGFVGAGLLPFAIVTGHLSTPATSLAFALTFLGELAERYLFFRAVDAPKMPGVPQA